MISKLAITHRVAVLDGVKEGACCEIMTVIAAAVVALTDMGLDGQEAAELTAQWTEEVAAKCRRAAGEAT